MATLMREDNEPLRKHSLSKSIIMDRFLKWKDLLRSEQRVPETDLWQVASMLTLADTLEKTSEDHQAIPRKYREPY